MRANSKASKLRQLFAELGEGTEGRQMVFGEGNPDACLVIIGEAPGRQEEMLGRPFVGRSGQLLDMVLRERKIDRNALWITNIVKWRPQRQDGSMRTIAPGRDEVNYFLPYLWKELQIIGPSALLCLGNSAARAVMGADFKMLRDHGKPVTIVNGIVAMAAYHPSYLLRWGGLHNSRVWRDWSRDINEARRFIDCAR
jgi:uracil-DNA glycosylase